MKDESEMISNNDAVDSDISESDGSNRRGFIAKTIFTGAGLAAGSVTLAAPQDQVGAQPDGENWWFSKGLSPFV